MDEMPFLSGGDEFRAVQALVRAGHWAAALERARKALAEGNLGRKHAARLHSLICWIETDGLHRTTPAAAMHAEEALRLSEQMGEDWVHCEALHRLVTALTHLGEFERAHTALAELNRIVELNSAALEGGAAGVAMLRASLLGAEGKPAEALAALEQAREAAASTAPRMLGEIRVRLVLALLALERPAEAVDLIGDLALHPAEAGESGPAWDLAVAWAALADSGPAEGQPLLAQVRERAQRAGDKAVAAWSLTLEAQAVAPADPGLAFQMAQEALMRAAQAGRMDLVCQFQRHLGTLLT